MAIATRSHNEWFRPVNTFYPTRTVTHKKADHQCPNHITGTCANGTVFTQLCSCPGHCRDCSAVLVPISPPEDHVVEQRMGPVQSKRKSCPTCKAKLEPNELVWSWGEYRIGKWRTVTHFCKSCFKTNVQDPLVDHRDDCGCSIELLGRGYTLPDWLVLPPCQQ